MNLGQLRPALYVTRREVRDQFRDWRIIIPILFLTVFFPALMNFTARQATLFVEKYGAEIVSERLIPFLLMVVGFFPISISLVIALESFVGEKERGSIEPLLCSPLLDWQMYLGKLLAATVPPLLGSYLGIFVYIVGLTRSLQWSPDPTLLIQVIGLTTLQALVMVSGAVVISTQTTSVRAANLLASFIIIPVSFLIQAESAVMFWANYPVLWWFLPALLLISILLIRTGIVHFNREELLGRELDTLNIAWGWRVFKSTFKGEATSFLQWFRVELYPTLSKIRTPFLIAGLLLPAAWIIGKKLTLEFPLPAEALGLNNLSHGLVQGFDAYRFFSPGGVLLVWLHNLRVILIATILGVFSFGVLGLIVLLLPLVLVCYFMFFTSAIGISPLRFLVALVLPHGVFEILAMLVAAALMLYLGGTLAAPAKGRTISEAFIIAIANWVKIMLGVVIPLLLLAALIEVYITPQLALRLLS